MNPGLQCAGQMADGVHGVMRASRLLMSALSTECPMVEVALWYGSGIEVHYIDVTEVQ